MQKFLLACIATVVFIFSGCGPSKEEQKEQHRAFIEKLEKEHEEKTEMANKKIMALSDKEISLLLYSCKEAIMQAARERYKPFEPFMVDEYSADIYQGVTHTSGGKINKLGDIAARVKQYREQVNSRLDTRFSVMVTQDSFNGPLRRSINASCEFEAEADSPLRPVARLLI